MEAPHWRPALPRGTLFRLSQMLAKLANCFSLSLFTRETLQLEVWVHSKTNVVKSSVLIITLTSDGFHALRIWEILGLILGSVAGFPGQDTTRSFCREPADSTLCAALLESYPNAYSIVGGRRRWKRVMGSSWRRIRRKRRRGVEKGRTRIWTICVEEWLKTRRTHGNFMVLYGITMFVLFRKLHDYRRHITWWRES